MSLPKGKGGGLKKGTIKLLIQSKKGIRMNRTEKKRKAKRRMLKQELTRPIESSTD